MSLQAILGQFFHDQSGAVTVDWIVIAACLTGMGISTVNVIVAEMRDLNSAVAVELRQDMVRRSFVETSNEDDDGETDIISQNSYSQ